MGFGRNDTQHNYKKCDTQHNYDKSDASICRQVEAWVSDLFCNLGLVKNHKTVYNSATTNTSEK